MTLKQLFFKHVMGIEPPPEPTCNGKDHSWSKWAPDVNYHYGHALVRRCDGCGDMQRKEVKLESRSH